MNDSTCPTCGAPLAVDALSGEPRPCSRCGAGGDTPYMKPIPDPEHQHRINKSKGFEIGAVIVMILVGLTFFQIRGRTSNDDPGISVVSLSNVVGAHDFNFSGESTIRGRKFLSYQKRDRVFQSSIDLIANAETNALEAVLIVVAHPGTRPFPPDAVAEPAIQESLDEATRFSGELIPTSVLALEKAGRCRIVGWQSVTADHGELSFCDGRTGTDRTLEVDHRQLRSVGADDERSANREDLDRRSRELRPVASRHERSALGL